jgi:hypothetical protein
MKDNESGESLFTITDELLYVREQRSGDVIPIFWDDLAGGAVSFWEDDGQATLAKGPGDPNGGLFQIRTSIKPRPQFQRLLTHLGMEKGWIQDFWIEGDADYPIAGVLFFNPEYRNSEEVWNLVRKYDLSARQQYFPIRQWAESRPMASIRYDFLRDLASMALKEEET